MATKQTLGLLVTLVYIGAIMGEYNGSPVYVALNGEDRDNCGRSQETPCGSLSKAVDELNQDGGIVYIDATGSDVNPSWACEPDSLILNVSMNLIGYNGKPTIGCHGRSGRLLEMVLGSAEAEINETMRFHFENINFQAVILNVNAGNGSIETSFDNTVMVDAKWFSPGTTQSLTFNFTHSEWIGHPAWNCSGRFSCEPTGFLDMNTLELVLILQSSVFRHTKLSVNVEGLSMIYIDDCLFSNIDNALSNHGEVYITIHSLFRSKVVLLNSHFERQVNAHPIQSIMNLYLAAFMVRSKHPVIGSPYGEPVVNVSNCSFENNERGLTFIGPFIYTSVQNCSFQGNVAMHAGAGILYLTDPSTPSYVMDSTFINNEAGSYRESKIDEYESSFQIMGDEVRIQSECCKGLISFVGKGGAIRIQRGNLTLINSNFLNNTARLLGGAIFVDRESSMYVDNVYFENTPISRHALQGDVFYSNGDVQIKSARMLIATAMNHVTIVRHSGDHWSIEVSDIVIKCPIGYRLRVTNTSAYGVTPIGLRRSYKLDQLSYNCESCPRHKYSLDYGYLNFSLVYSSFAYYTLLINGEQPQTAYTGTYQYQDIECQQCPYGGRCQQGITAVPNFWGYIYNNQVRFQHCPKGYCCSNTLCDSYSTCAKHREGKLCGSCQSGYSEALFSSQCIRDDNCDSTWLWPLAVGTGLSYALFLLLQKDIRDLMFLNTVKLKDIPFPWRKTATANMQMMPMKTANNIMSLPLKDDIEIESLPPDRETNIDKWSRDNNNLRRRSGNSDDHSEEDTDIKIEPAIDTGASFLIILFYYFQDAQLLHIKTVFASEENKTRDLFKEILSGLFKFRIEIFQFMDNVCFLSGITPTSKLLIKVILVPFVLMLFGLMYIIFRFFQGCKRKSNRHAYMNGNTSNGTLPGHIAKAHEPKKTFASKLATGFVLSLLFTYQKLATTCFTLLNCVPIGEEKVLFIEGTVTCYTMMQYGVMVYTAVCIVPFCLVLLIGPGLLKQGYIGLPQFFCACIMPLPFLAYWVILRLHHKGQGPSTLPDHSEEATSVMAILQGPFKDNVHKIFGPLCGAGVLLGRRLVLILLFTFVNDTLIRMLCMMMVCFVILLHHVHVLPYKDTRGNVAGSASAAALLVVGGINLVRAGFEAAEYDPQGPNKLLMHVFDEVELVLMLWFPAAVMGVAILSMTFKIILHILKYCLTPSDKHLHKS